MSALIEYCDRSVKANLHPQVAWREWHGVNARTTYWAFVNEWHRAMARATLPKGM